MLDGDLPTIAQIKAATEILSQPDAHARVVKINDQIAVKFGTRVSLLEAETMKFIAANSRVPVPRVFAAFSEIETKMNFIVMEFVPGRTLEALLPTLSAEEKVEINIQVKNAIDELRKLQAPNYIGGVNRQPLNNAIFWVPDHDPAISGPFATEAEMNEGMLQHLEQLTPAAYVQFVRGMMNSTLCGHRTVLTHGDLQPKNIMVNRISGHKDNNGRLEIHLIDWESAAWYPEYWEFCSSTFGCRFRPEWLELVQHILHQYPAEYLMMQVIHSVVYY
jgi:aminoglycoside phosphotransferase (APT) family kinase protein